MFGDQPDQEPDRHRSGRLAAPALARHGRDGQDHGRAGPDRPDPHRPSGSSAGLPRWLASTARSRSARRRASSFPLLMRPRPCFPVARIGEPQPQGQLTPRGGSGQRPVGTGCGAAREAMVPRSCRIVFSCRQDRPSRARLWEAPATAATNSSVPGRVSEILRRRGRFSCYRIPTRSVSEDTSPVPSLTLRVGMTLRCRGNSGPVRFRESSRSAAGVLPELSPEDAPRIAVAAYLFLSTGLAYVTDRFIAARVEAGWHSCAAPGRAGRDLPGETARPRSAGRTSFAARSLAGIAGTRAAPPGP